MSSSLGEKVSLARAYSLHAGDGTLVPTAGEVLPLSTLFEDGDPGLVDALTFGGVGDGNGDDGDNSGDGDTLDRSMFSSQLNLVAVVLPAASTCAAMEKLRPFLFNKPKVKAVLGPDQAPELFEAAASQSGAGSAGDKRRAILLNEEFSAAALASSTSDEYPSGVDSLLANMPEAERAWCVEQGCTVGVHPLVLGYELLSVEQVLRALIPTEVAAEVPSSFETAGHVAHLNLREEVLPWKRTIGQVILDKNPRLKTVVNKTASIASEFRTFPLEVLGGDPNLVVELKEGGGVFKFDFGQVYWNSRLQHEHARLADAIANRVWGLPYDDDAAAAANVASVVSSSGSAVEEAAVGTKRPADASDNNDKAVAASSHGEQSSSGRARAIKKQKKGRQNGDERPGGKAALFNPRAGAGLIVADCMAGVGPFAVPLGLRGCAHVHANDLNPHSYRWLVENLALNKLGPKQVTPYNLDARIFVAILRGRMPRPSLGISASSSSTEVAPLADYMVPVWFDHAILNLPASAIDFLDAFRGFLYTRDPKAAHAYGEGDETPPESEDAVDANGDMLCPVGLQLDPCSDMKESARPLPMIHVHCFEREFEDEPTAEGAKARAVARAAVSLGAPLVYPSSEVAVHVVRYVSPQKPMLCISFRLPRQAALLPPVKLKV